MSRLICSVAVLLAFAAQSPSPGIVIDGAFGDWARVPAAYRTPGRMGNQNAGLVLQEVRVQSDGRSLAVSIDIDRAVNLQALPGGLQLTMVANLDGNDATGERVGDLPGVDLSLEFSRPAIGGVMVRRFPPQQGPSGPATAGLLLSPISAAHRFEFRLDRGPARTATLKFLFVSHEVVRDASSAIPIRLPTYEPVRTLAETDRVPQSDPLARRDGTTVRVLVWNVAGSSLAREPAARILRAIAPDVMMLDEFGHGSSVPEIERRLDTITPAPNGGWHAALSRGGQGTMVAVRGRIDPVIGRVEYTPGSLDRLYAALRPDDRWMVAEFEDGGVSASAAVVTIGGRRLLAVPLDLRCCRNAPESTEDAHRVLEAHAIHEAVRAALGRVRVDGILVGGDFNLVSTQDPLDVVRRGLDVNRSNLSVANVLNLDGASNSTDRPNPNARFVPARLDWLLYGASSLRELGGFVFHSAKLSPFWLLEHDIRVDDSANVSSHLPIVVDFSWRR